MNDPKVLLLNATYEPLKVITWQKSIELWCLDKVDVIREYPDVLRSVNFEMNYPAVVRLRNYVNQYKNRLIRFSRINIFTRDGYRCQYCGNDFPYSKLTMDHVIPKSRGGKTNWTNILTCCLECNWVKANQTPEEARMKPLSLPREPDVFSSNVFAFRGKNIPDEWLDYVGNLEKESA